MNIVVIYVLILLILLLAINIIIYTTNSYIKSGGMSCLSFFKPSIFSPEFPEEKAHSLRYSIPQTPLNTNKKCRVKGCTFCKSENAHYCKNCKNKDSDHFASDCPYTIKRIKGNKCNYYNSENMILQENTHTTPTATATANPPKIAIHDGGNSCLLGHHYADKGKKVGLIIAGNSGRPGGNAILYHLDGRLFINPHIGYRTQEESVVSNWIITSSNQLGHTYEEIANNICNEWGLKNINGVDNMTIQGKNYTKNSDYLYMDAWVINNQQGEQLCVEENDNYNFYKLFNAKLIFIAGPNAKKPDGAKKSQSHNILKSGVNVISEHSMERTYNSEAANNYEIFKRCISDAVIAGLYAANENNCEIVIFPHISGGIYAGDHNTVYTINEFKKIVEGVCNTYYFRYIEEIIIIKYDISKKNNINL